MDYSANRLKKIAIYDNLKDETNYTCNGSCTCKFLKDRSNYDQMQYQVYEDHKKIKLPNFDMNKYKNPNSKGWL
jgi:hypothetical protein